MRVDGSRFVTSNFVNWYRNSSLGYSLRDYWPLPASWKKLPAIHLSPLSGLLTESLMPSGIWPLCGHTTHEHWKFPRKPWIYWITASRSYTSTEQCPTLIYPTLLWPLASFWFTFSYACKTSAESRSPTSELTLKWTLQGKLWPNRRALSHHSLGETAATEKGNTAVAGNTNLIADQLRDNKQILLPI